MVAGVAEVADLFVRLRAETAPFTAGMRRASEEGESFTTRMGGAQAMLRKVGAATTLVGVGFVAYGVKAAGDFQQKMNLLVTACGESSRNLKKVSDGVLSLARETGTSTDQLSEGMYQVEKAGYRSGAGLQVLRAAAQGAREEGADLKDVTNAMTSVMASYHLKASDSVRVMNALKTAAGEGKMTMQEFAGSLSTVIPIASANKISFGEVGGAIATLTQHGTSAREATQELASTIRQLAAPNNVAIQEMQRLGLSSTDVSTKLGKRGLSGTLDLLSRTVLEHMGKSGTLLLSSFNKTKQAAADADQMVKSMPPNLQKLANSYAKGSISLGDWRKQLKGLPPEQANLLTQYATLQNKTTGFSAELKKGGPAAQTYTEAIKKMTGGAIGLNTTLQLTGENTEGFKNRVHKVSDSFNHASKNVEGWKITQQSFNVQMGRLKEAVTTAAITVGSKLIPVILKVITFFEKHKAAAVALAAVVGGVLTAAMVSFAAGATTNAVKSVSELGKGLLTAGKAVRAFATSEAVAAAASKVLAAGQAILNAVMDANPVMLIVLAIAALVAGLIYAYNHCTRFRMIVQAAFAGVKIAAVFLWHALQAAWNGIVTGVMWLWHHIESAWNAVVSVTTTVWNAISGFFKKWWPLLLVIFAAPVAVLMAIWNHFHAQITAVATTVWNAISGFFKAIWSGISSAASTVWQLIAKYIIAPNVVLWHALEGLWHTVSGWLSSAWDGIKAVASAVWNAIKSAMINPIMSAWHSIASTITSIALAINNGLHAAWNAVKNVGSWFLSIGRAIVMGIINGISGAAGSLFSSLQHLAEGALSAAKSFLGIHSPSRKFAEIGAYIGAGLVSGLTGSTARVRAATEHIARMLYVDFGSHHRALQAAVARDNRDLMRLAEHRDHVAAKLKAAQKKLKDIQKTWADEQKSVASGIMQGFSVVTDAPQEGFALSAQDVVNKMQSQMQKATQFAAQLQALKAKGLSAGLLAQIAAAGVDQGGVTAAALQGASKSQIDQINAAQAATKKAAGAAGAAVADSMYGAGLKSAQGLVKGLQSQEKAIEAQMMRIAKSMQKAIKKALGIRSPSTVFRDLGVYIPQGLAVGIETATHHAVTATRGLAASVAAAGPVGVGASGPRSLALAGAGGGATTVVHNRFEIHIEPKGPVLTTNRELRDLVQEEFLRLGGRNAQTWQPYKRG